jgi:hypothetical protein
MAGLSIRTLYDDIEELPRLPSTITGGQTGWRAFTSPNERFSRFDATLLRWQPIEPSEQDGLTGVVLIPGEALRRRKGRGAADFYIAAAERGGGIRLLPANETSALLVGYANATASAQFVLAAEIDHEALILPEIDLPPPHHEILKRLILPGTQDQRVVGRGRELAERVFAKLGIQFLI